MSHSKKRLTKLTGFEEEVMKVLWREGASGVHQVIAALPYQRKKTYTSVSTILRILEGKKFVCAVKQGRGHLYSAYYSLADYMQQSLDQLIENSFSNQPAQLVSYLIDNNRLSEVEIKQIEALIREKGDS